MANARVSTEWKDRVERARAAFAASGTSVSDWARERRFSPKLVAMVLRGDRPCLRGESHRIAVALGLKADAAPPRPAQPRDLGSMEPAR